MASLSLESIAAEDFEALFALRMAAMRESLDRLGLGDVQRSRDRFTSQFDAQRTQYILRDGERIGFVLLKPAGDHLHLEQLFIRPGAQGSGAGAWVLDWVKSHGQDVTLSALKLSDSNRFYRRHGFEPVGENELEIEYHWKAPQ
ncbi:GNAT family N-acetyltransferase [Paucibacter sp. PLA-PC-4]|uniref:GNAT family N-acetyltransferase n=1 Tax=Paucibacter sp. PLA-PC-4 TaxID=2993655 RepID=UPI002248BC8A|nr:GNAT family N-acetyltransferase [Paucibacter sp. PLA-PC-4]MCX2861632.1 GNAT family N-acetyltransferase [Paucibacter sp. PLA-PC-4]